MARRHLESRDDAPSNDEETPGSRNPDDVLIRACGKPRSKLLLTDIAKRAGAGARPLWIAQPALAPASLLPSPLSLHTQRSEQEPADLSDLYPPT